MAKKSISKMHCNYLASLFKGQLSISDRSYNANIYRLNDYIENFKDEVTDNCLDLNSECKSDYYSFLLKKLQGICIDYDQKLLDQKLEKYGESKASFPEFSNEALNQLLLQVPAKPVKEYIQEDLARHSLTTQTQKAFFRYWMSVRKKELEDWLTVQFEVVPKEEEPENDTSGPLGTLYRKVAYCDKRALIPFIEEAGGDVAKELAALFGRPINKVQLQLEKLSNKSSQIAPNSRQDKDNKIVDDFIDFGRRGR